MASDIFLKVDGADGESQDENHAAEIELQSYSFGVSQSASVTASSVGGGTTARATFHDLVVNKELDLASAKLQEFCSTGKHIDSVILSARRAAGDDKVEYLKYTLTDSIISNYSISGGGNSIPMESVSFNYGKIEFEYKQQARAGGTESGTASFGYDLKTNTKV